MCFLLLESSQKLSAWSPRVRKGSTWPKRINLEKVGPNHEFPVILMKTHRDGELAGQGCYDITCRAQQFKLRREKPEQNITR